MQVGSRVSVCLATNRSVTFQPATIVAVHDTLDGAKRYDVRTDAGAVLRGCDASSLRAIIFEAAA
jgi:hypothetical protein